MVRRGERVERLRPVSQRKWSPHERHLRRGTMWDFYWEINKVKMIVNLRRCRVSRAKWERDWVAFITRSWEGSEEVDMDAKHCVYDATMPFANVE